MATTSTVCSCYFIIATVALLHIIGHCSEWQLTVLINPFNGARNDTCYESGEGPVPSSQITCEDISAGFQFRTSSTMFILRPGVHYLSSSVVFNSVKQLAIVGDNGSNSTVVCKRGAGFSFVNITDVTLQWVTYLGCGVLQNSTSVNLSTNTSDLSFLKFLVGFYFYQCHDVILDYITIADSLATGLVMYDTVGSITITNSAFCNNSVPDSNTSGGGGVAVEFSFCKPGDETCDNDHFQVGNNSHSTYVFHNCTFAENKANITEKYEAFIMPYHSYHEALGHGGGLSMFFKGDATNNTFVITNCSFRQNQALWGGGLIVHFEDSSIANVVNVTSCHFESNRCYYNDTYGTGGGAFRLSMYNYFGSSTASRWNGNRLLMQDSTFKENRALNGGAISIEAALQSETPSKQIIRVNMRNCTFVSNSARLGSAVDIHLLPVIFEGKIPQVDVTDCVFINNTVKYTNVALYNTGVGAVYISEVPVAFLSSVHFEQNVGSALSAFDTQLNFSNCRATFKSNHGKDGGAIALLGAAYLLINDSTNMTFINNTAEQRGGAIYNMYVSKNSMKTYIGCFLRYETPFIKLSQRKSRFTFDSNDASQGKSIFSTSILPCAWNFGSGIEQDIQHILCWDEEHWNYSGQNCTDEIYTEANSFSYVGSPIPGVLPGQQFSLPITVYDDMSHDISKQIVYQASIQNSSIARVNPKFAYVANSEMSITALDQSENYSVVLNLDTVGSPVWHIDVDLQIQPCPPGLTPVTGNETKWNTTCQCFSPYPYGGRVKCSVDDDSYKVEIRNGFWIGKIESNLTIMGECFYYCRTGRNDNFYPLSNVPDLDSYICGVNHRTGVLCGKCAEGYGPTVNSWTFVCVACNDSDIARRTVKYFFATYVPLVFLFLAIIVFKVQLTTGPANAFVLYAQMISSAFDVSAGGATSLNTAFSRREIQWMLDAYYFVYGVFNLDFVSYLLNPYCLTQSFNNLDVLQLQYFVALFPLFMIIAVLLFLKAKESCFKRCFWRCRQQSQNQGMDAQSGGSERRKWRFTDNLLHAFVAFTLLSYTKFGTASTFILSSTVLFDESGNPVGSRRVNLAGQFSVGDKQYIYEYGLPAGIILATFVSLPPLLLLGPLQWFNQLVVPRVSLLRRYWPSIKVNIVLDAFQGCYKPHTRFFAGLYFLFRLAVLANYAFTTSIFQQYVIQQVLATVMVALLAIFQPYRRQLLNYVDLLIFLNMAILNSLSTFILISSETNPQAPFPKAAFIILYILVFLPLAYMIGYLFYHFIIRNRKRLVLRLKLWYSMCCCKEQDESFRPLLDDASRQLYGNLRDDSSLLARAEEANTFKPSPSVRRAVGLDTDTTSTSHTRNENHSAGSRSSTSQTLPSVNQDSGMKSKSTNTSTHSRDLSPSGDDSAD